MARPQQRLRPGHGHDVKGPTPHPALSLRERVPRARSFDDGSVTILVLAFRLLAPAATTIFVLSFVASWNNYFLPLVVLNDSAHFPVTVGLANWYASATSGSGGALLFTVVMAGSLVSILPVILAFLMIQRFWQGGLATGAVKT